MNNERDATLVAILFSGILLFGLTYIVFGERLGIKSLPPNDKSQGVYLAK